MYEETIYNVCRLMSTVEVKDDLLEAVISINNSTLAFSYIISSTSPDKDVIKLQHLLT